MAGPEDSPKTVEMSDEPRRGLRVIVCGGRKYSDEAAVVRALKKVDEGLVPGCLTLVHGACSGADTLAAKVAKRRGWFVEAHVAQWRTLGAGAGPIRNQEMVDAGADLLIAFPGGRGTADCVERAVKAGIPVTSRGSCLRTPRTP